MLRHTVLFRWNPDTTPAQIEAVATRLATLPGAIDTVRSYRFGPDAGINPGNFEYVVTADFDDRDGYVVYRDHPAHRALITELLDPLVAQRAAAQFEH